ncbi:MAG: hypothetical protein COY38_03500 [Candidatus Aenigmarchaeota archaeon CG_4_10_14_0_8_um_filter_37_24]|nr:hypothetical protein [Candidatus Aenigmarchaeota archaeon]OIN88492.1 MAG: hypothetical protein AUJ50_00820 [Candidatus Aenigmarchaeota archaeon CG1_02_38_14]OIP32453.1 MAG: hypothetical protein AUK23_04345 [Deltaproteobacteria bacterium CG2_30_43_15]PIV69637.1 MAG: hypothetical protein COS07_00045 [Candidatus Aenigmarchaeota archaeon CG01_land_8_20_14_3_00_37_9]PIW41615.1 MAG: hypothetical protein COW21_00990 [Candidatus Aenigmarchaeota archaeon CG15_BIG_FIL_POST_REV_8_21_14_020_37_27]PIX50
MPIFARTKLIIHDDCFEPSAFSGPDMSFKYKGKDPHLAYNKIREMFWTVFGVRETERVQEKNYTWDKKGNRETFSVAWYINKDMDRLSYLLFNVKMKGFIETTENGKEGELNVEIAGVMRTEYPQDNMWERTIFYEMARVFWHKVFYNDKREKYMEICREISTNFTKELKSFFNLLPKSG